MTDRPSACEHTAGNADRPAVRRVRETPRARDARRPPRGGKAGFVDTAAAALAASAAAAATEPDPAPHTNADESSCSAARLGEPAAADGTPAAAASIVTGPAPGSGRVLLARGSGRRLAHACPTARHRLRPPPPPSASTACGGRPSAAAGPSSTAAGHPTPKAPRSQPGDTWVKAAAPTTCRARQAQFPCAVGPGRAHPERHEEATQERESPPTGARERRRWGATTDTAHSATHGSKSPPSGGGWRWWREGVTSPLPPPQKNPNSDNPPPSEVGRCRWEAATGGRMTPTPRTASRTAVRSALPVRSFLLHGKHHLVQGLRPMAAHALLHRVRCSQMGLTVASVTRQAPGKVNTPASAAVRRPPTAPERRSAKTEPRTHAGRPSPHDRAE